MGYDTSFAGEFDLDKPLSEAQIAYLNAFSNTRRIARNTTRTELLDDPLRVAVGLPVGEEGGFYVGGIETGNGVINFNNPPEGQPGLWCQWVPTDDGLHIEWDGGEKFYDYVEWLKYIIKNFLEPWGFKLSGAVNYQGESSDDRGTIYAKDNIIEDINDEIVKRGPSWQKK